MRSLADVLDTGPTPADAPEEDWALLDELTRAVAALTEKLKAEPELSRAEARLFCKQTAPEQSIHFRSLIWPQARKLAGLPAGLPGRPRTKAVTPPPQPERCACGRLLAACRFQA